MKYYLDSNIWIHILKKTLAMSSLKSILDAKVYTSDIVLLEVADFCIRNKKDPVSILEFIRNKSELIQLSNEILVTAANIKKTQRKTRTEFGIADATHYACAQNTHCILLTSDNDFIGLENIEIM